MRLPVVDTGNGECGIGELTDRVGHTAGDDEVIPLAVQGHPVHGLDVVGRPSPVPLGGQVAEHQPVLTPGGDGGDGLCDLAADEIFRAAR